MPFNEDAKLQNRLVALIGNTAMTHFFFESTGPWSYRPKSTLYQCNGFIRRGGGGGGSAGLQSKPGVRTESRPLQRGKVCVRVRVVIRGERLATIPSLTDTRK